MEISNIVTVGCSFTFCQGLPINKGWPALLAEHLNCPLVNLGVPGASNGTIHRKTYEYIYNNSLVTDSKPLVIVAWTQPWRKEAWSKVHYKDNNFNDYAPIFLPDEKDKPSNYYEYALLENFNDEDFFRTTIINKLSLSSLFKTHNIPYIMTDAMSQDFELEVHEKMNLKFPGFIANKYDNFYIGSLAELTKNIKSLPCGHWNEEGNIVVEDFIFSKIKRLYPDLVFKNNEKFLTLTDYLDIDKYGQKFPEWKDFKL